jgi:hypothetical protein
MTAPIRLGCQTVANGESPQSGSTDRISTIDDLIDQHGDCLVLLDLDVGTLGTFMCGGGIFENAHDLVFWQDLRIIQRKKQRFAD